MKTKPNNGLKSRFKISREVILALAWLFISIGIWWAQPITEFTRQENIIITVALGIFDLLLILMFSLFRRYSEVIKTLRDASKVKENDISMDRFEGQLNELTMRVFKERQDYDMMLVKAMADQNKYLVDRGEWYLETSKLCRAMRGLNGEIMAISAFNIEDFIIDDNAKKYLGENAQAIQNGIRVRRIFIIDGEDLFNRDTRFVLNEHDRKLKAPENAKSPVKESGVKWILGRHAGDDKGQDFALFYPYVVVRQRPGGRQLEVCQQKVEIDDAFQTFERLWEKQAAKQVSQLPPMEKQV